MSKTPRTKYIRKAVADFLRSDTDLTTLLGHTSSDTRILYEQPERIEKIPALLLQEVNHRFASQTDRNLYKTQYDFVAIANDKLIVADTLDMVEELFYPASQGAEASMDTTLVHVYTAEGMERISPIEISKYGKWWNGHLLCTFTWRLTLSGA
jgi:hypothetical protein